MEDFSNIRRSLVEGVGTGFPEEVYGTVLELHWLPECGGVMTQRRRLSPLLVRIDRLFPGLPQLCPCRYIYPLYIEDPEL